MFGFYIINNECIDTQPNQRLEGPSWQCLIRTVICRLYCFSDRLYYSRHKVTSSNLLTRIVLCNESIVVVSTISRKPIDCEKRYMINGFVQCIDSVFSTSLSKGSTSTLLNVSIYCSHLCLLPLHNLSHYFRWSVTLGVSVLHTHFISEIIVDSFSLNSFDIDKGFSGH